MGASSRIAGRSRVGRSLRRIGALPNHHRNVIMMRDIEEMEYPDMADLLGCTVGGAKLRVLRARRALRDRPVGGAFMAVVRRECNRLAHAVPPCRGLDSRAFARTRQSAAGGTSQRLKRKRSTSP
ncbi:MAG: hypothetical protein IH884_14460, partial [Myxococcales bacterium]|nr:hypothetical protein [Myxococcales bacterium]